MYLLKGRGTWTLEYIERRDRENERRRGWARESERRRDRANEHRPKAEECHPIYCITGRLSIHWKLSAFVARRYLDDICARAAEKEEEGRRE